MTDFLISFKSNCCPEPRFWKMFHLWFFSVKLWGFTDCHFISLHLIFHCPIDLKRQWNILGFALIRAVLLLSLSKRQRALTRQLSGREFLSRSVIFMVFFCIKNSAIEILQRFSIIYLLFPSWEFFSFIIM